MVDYTKWDRLVNVEEEATEERADQQNNEPTAPSCAAVQGMGETYDDWGKATLRKMLHGVIFTRNFSSGSTDYKFVGSFGVFSIHGEPPTEGKIDVALTLVWTGMVMDSKEQQQVRGECRCTFSEDAAQPNIDLSLTSPKPEPGYWVKLINALEAQLVQQLITFRLKVQEFKVQRDT